MKNEKKWEKIAFSDAFEINPKVNLVKGKIYPFINMDAMNQNNRNVFRSEYREYTGSGSKFISDDTLMARITPCLENGKIAGYKSSEKEEEIAFGSTEFIVIRGKKGLTDNTFAYYYLPEWDSSLNESDYNNFAKNENRVCLDQKFCHIDGRGKIEVCDLLEFPSTFIHVKKYHSSQTMGHLFNQGVVSALVLREDKTTILSWLKEKNIKINTSNIETDKDIEIVFAIGINSDNRSIPQSLPFFSKVALFNAKKTIEKTCGYKIALCKIPFDRKNGSHE